MVTYSIFSAFVLTSLFGLSKRVTTDLSRWSAHVNRSLIEEHTVTGHTSFLSLWVIHRVK